MEVYLKHIHGNRQNRNGIRLVKFFQLSLKRLTMVISSSLLEITIMSLMLKMIVDLQRVFLSMKVIILWKLLRNIVQEKVSVEETLIKLDNSWWRTPSIIRINHKRSPQLILLLNLKFNNNNKANLVSTSLSINSNTSSRRIWKVYLRRFLNIMIFWRLKTTPFIW